MTAYAILYSTLLILSVLGGVLLGHFLTMRAFAHVQPSSTLMAKVAEGTVTTEPDPYADVGEMPPTDEERAAELLAEFEKTGLPSDIINPERFMGKTGMRPSQAPKAQDNGEEESEPEFVPEGTEDDRA